MQKRLHLIFSQISSRQAKKLAVPVAATVFRLSSVSIYIFVIPFLQKRSRNVALLHR